MAKYRGDGWKLLSAEAHRDAAPETFKIPPLSMRTTLQRGDCAKLLFDIVTHEPEGPVWCVERMWVRVRRVSKHGYVGTLANDPLGGDPDGLVHGSVVEFAPHHIADVSPNGWHVARVHFEMLRPDLDLGFSQHTAMHRTRN